MAIVDSGAVKSFEVIDALSRSTVLTGAPSYSASTSWSGNQRTALDFSSLTAPGKYQLVVDGDTAGAVTFVIKEDALSGLADAALKAFYYQRTGMPIEEKYAGKWHRPTAHPDTKVYVHPDAAA